MSSKPSTISRRRSLATCPHERLKDLAAADDHVDCDAWAALAEAGVVGASIPEAHGGAGLGFLATAMAMQVAGAHASPIRFCPRSCGSDADQ